MNVGARPSSLLDFFQFGIDDNKNPVRIGDVDGNYNHIHLVQFLHNVHRPPTYFSHVRPLTEEIRLKIFRSPDLLDFQIDSLTQARMVFWPFYSSQHSTQNTIILTWSQLSDLSRNQVDLD